MDYLFIPNIDAFRLKMTQADGVLANIRDQLLRLASEEDPGPVPEAAAFAYLLTGEERYARKYREILLPQFKVINFDGCTEAQAHTAMAHLHIQAAATARAMIYFDWTADSPAYSPDETAWMLDSFLNYIHYQPYPGGLRGGGNRSASAYLCVLVGAYLCAVKRDDSPRARFLLQRALSTFQSQAGHMAPHGYGCEGCAYQFGIHAPAVARACDFYEKLSGKDVFDRRFPPADVSIRDILEVTLNQMTPAGNLLAWDNYGIEAADSAQLAAYMCLRGGGHRWFMEMLECDAAYMRRQMLWGSDDPIWLCLWWPDELRELQPADCPGTSWMLPAVGAALEDRQKGLHFFQMWDTTRPRNRRWNGNPNSILFEAYESPLLNDGADDHGGEGSAAFDHDAYFRENLTRVHSKAHGKTDPKAYARGANFGSGTFDAHNVILVDIDQEENLAQDADSEVHGDGTYFFNSPLMDVVQGDCSRYYPGRFNIDSVLRTSLFVKPDYVITLDNVDAAKPHRFSYRLHLRPQLTVADGAGRIVTAEQVALHIVPLEKVEWLRSDCRGFPSQLEGRSERLDLSQTGETISFTVLLVPEELKKNKRDVSAGWALQAREEGQSQTSGSNEAQPAIVNAAYPWFFQGAATDVRQVTLSQDVEIPAVEEGERIYLRLGRKAPEQFALHVNGKKIEPLVADSTLPLRFDITDAVEPGTPAGVEVELGSNGYDGMVGRWQIYTAGSPRLSPKLERLKDGIVAVDTGQDRDVVILDNQSGATREVEGWVTDARRAALRSRDAWRAIGATTLATNDAACLRALYPTSAGCREKLVFIEVTGMNSIEISSPGIHLNLQCHSTIDIACYENRQNMTLVLQGLNDRMVFLNNESVAVATAGDHGEIEIPVVSRESCDVETRLAKVRGGERNDVLDAMAALSFVHDRDDVVAALGNYLQDADIHLRTAALEALGRIRNPAAVPPLVEAMRAYYSEPNPALGYSVQMMNEWRYRAEVVFSLMKHRDVRALSAFKECLELADAHPGKRSQSGCLRQAIALMEAGVETLDPMDAVTNLGQNP